MNAEAGPSPDSISKITVGAWFDPARGQQRDDAIAVLAAHRVVLLGETHSDAEHHRWQLRTIEPLFDIRPDIALGFEMFPRHVQPVLERWRNDDISETAFLAEVDWPRIWGFDADLYWPLFRFARRHRLPMLALNVDRETTRRIAREGIANTSPEQREHVGDARAGLRALPRTAVGLVQPPPGRRRAGHRGSVPVRQICRGAVVLGSRHGRGDRGDATAIAPARW